MKLFPAIRKSSLPILVAASLTAYQASAEPLVVTGFTKIVDGTDDVPEATGQPDPVDYFRDNYFFPAFGVSHDGQRISHDGTKTAFIGCTANATNSDCETNEFGLYYGDGSDLYFIRDFQSSGGVPWTASIGGDTVSWLECTIFFGCSFNAGMEDLPTNNSFLLAVGSVYPTTNITGDYIALGTGSGVERYKTDSNTSTTIVSTSTLVPDEDTFFSRWGRPAISANFLAFYGEGNSGVKGIFTNDNSDNVITVVTSGMPLPESPASTFTDFEEMPEISGNDVVFIGYGSGGQHRLYRNDGTTNTVLLSFAELGITPMRYINFYGDTVLFGDAGATNKLYLYNDGDLSVAIQSGDMLDGKTVDKLDLTRSSLAANSFAFPVLFTNGETAIYVAEFAPPVTDVVIDVPGTLHPHHDGSASAVAGLNDVIDVVVFGSSIANGDAEDFVANQINPASLKFGPAEGSIKPGSTPVFAVDVDSDGDNDAQFEFLTGDTGLACASTEATLIGETNTGDMFQGTDSVATNCDALCHN